MSTLYWNWAVSLITTNPWANLAEEQLAPVVLRQFDHDVAPSGGRSSLHVDSHVDDTSGRHPHEFGLRLVATLEMQTPQHSARRHRFVVLNEIHPAYVGLEFLALEAFHEISSFIAETAGLDDPDSWYICGGKLHVGELM